MSAETDDIELAQWLNGIGSSRQRSETPTNDPGATKTIYGTATSDSDNGIVYVDLEGTTVSGSGEQSVPLTTTCPVKNGQKVIITLVNNDPVVTGVAGWGDEANQKIAAAEAIAKAAIQAVDVEYALGESQTTPPESGWSTTAPEWREGMYMWQRTVTYTSEGTSYSDPTCIQGAAGRDGVDGKDGENGKDGTSGRGIASTEVKYQSSQSNTTVPTGDWLTTIPSVQEGWYLWTRTQFTYTDSTVSYGYSVSRQGADGAAGSDGAPGAPGTDGKNGKDGADGVGVSGSEVKYQASNSGTTAPTGAWLASPPSLNAGQYLWTRTTITYTDGKSTVSYSISMKGETGPQGIQGEPGADGQPRYTWLKYADTPTSGMSDLPDGKDYIGLAYNKTTSSESSNYSDYTWSKIVGEQGPQGVQGVQGVPGPAGENGSTLYTWIKYADNASGGGMSDNPSGKKYIGLAYNKTVSTESSVASDYAWSLIQGADGKDGSDGAKGDTGIGVKAVVEQYYLSTSSTTQSDGSWSTNQPEWSEGKYIWTRSQVTWTDNTVTTTTPVLAKAINGANENANEAVNKVEEINYYFWTDSSGAHVTTQPNDATSGPNILIDGNGFHIRQGEVETAFFKSNEIGLGSNSQTSVIRMCGGLGEIGTVASSSSSVLALFGELVGLKGSSGSVVGNNLANLTTTDDDAVLSANGSIVLNSKISYISTENTDSRIYLFGTNGYLKPYISSGASGYNGPILSGKTYAGIEAGTANSVDLNTGVYCIGTSDKNSNGIVFNALQFLPGSNGPFLPIETLYNHAVMAMPDSITTTQTNVFQVGKFHSIAQTGNYVSVDSSGAIKISHAGTYLISLYGVWADDSSGDYMHFAIGPSSSDVRFALQRVVHGPWDSGSKTGMLRFTEGTVLYPMVKCEQGVPNSLSGGDNPGNAGQSSCFIQYVGE